MKATMPNTLAGKKALWLWGRLKDFERLKMFDRKPGDLIAGMTEPMKDDCRRLIPQLQTWLARAGDEELR